MADNTVKSLTSEPEFGKALNDKELTDFFWDCLKDSKSWFDPIWKKAERLFDAYAGETLSDADKSNLQRTKRPPIDYNLMLGTVNAVVGGDQADRKEAVFRGTGLEAGLAACATPYLATAPCDSPFLPPDLVPRLAEALCEERASVAIACTGDRLHPVFALMHRFTLPDLQAFTRAGGRKMELWLRRLKWVACPFDHAPTAFANINTPDELRAHQAGDFPR